MREERHKDQIEPLRDRQHDQRNPKRRADVLDAIKARRQDLDRNQPDQTDRIGQYCAAGHVEVLSIEAAIVKEQGGERFGHQCHADHAGQGKQRRQA